MFVLLTSIAAAEQESYQPELYGKNIACGDDHTMTLLINHDSEKETYMGVLEYLIQDDTSEILYEDGEFECTDYAETLHNNAESDGIECNVVFIEYGKHPHWNNNKLCIEMLPWGHVCNAFPLDDGSVLYIDCTEGDWISDLELGEKYAVTSIYDSEDKRQGEQVRDFTIVE